MEWQWVSEYSCIHVVYKSVCYLQGVESGPPPQSAEALAVADALSGANVTGKATSSEVQSAAESLLPIVQSQRERFRLRAEELEAVSIPNFIYM